MGNIVKAVEYMVKIANDDTHGYDQQNRNSPNYDCSSLVGEALHIAGFKVSPYSWTGNLYKQMVGCGFVLVKNINDRKTGDVFLTPKKHVIMCVDADNIVHASINEKGGVVGGKTGDQTGKEICVRSFYIPSYGWTYHLRYVGKTDTEKLKPLSQIAKEVVLGVWGNGNKRKTALENAGYIYSDVQKEVNKLFNTEPKKSELEVAREVVLGNWGNGTKRKERLEAHGYDYNKIQKLVNSLLK